MGTLTDKIILISGGTQGVGAGIARAAAREGATVVVSGRRADVGEAFAAELTAEGIEASFVQADVADIPAAQRSVATVIERHGRIDGLVNAAGLTTRGTLLDTTPELFDDHVAINLKAPFFLMQAAVSDMITRGAPGSIVNVITMSAHGGQPYLAPYVASKAGLIGLTKNAAHAHRWDKIRINGINIGWTETAGEDEIQRRFHGAGDDWLEKAGRVAADGQARSGGRRGPTRGTPVVRRQRGGHRVDHRLGPECARRPRLMIPLITPRRRQMKIGLIGLGRIGTYHAANLVALDEVEQLVVTDAVPAAVASAVERFGATPADSVESLLGAVDAVMITAPTSLHLGLIQQSVAAGLPTFCEKPVAEDPYAARDLLAWIEDSGRRGADRLPAPLRPGVRRGQGGPGVRRAGLPDHGAVHHDGPRAAADVLHRRLRWDLPRLRHPRPRRGPLGDRPGGRRGVRDRGEQGRPRVHRASPTSTPLRPCSPSTTAPSG